MKRLIGATLAMSLALSGSSPAERRPISPSAAAIDPSSLPSELPSAVKRQEVDAATAELDAFETPSSPFSAAWGSAVQLGPNRFITAGHLVVDSSNQPYLATRQCGNLVVRTKIAAENLEAKKVVGSFVSGDGSVPDLAIIETKLATSDPLLPYGPPQYANGDVHPGEDVFFVNYEPTATDKPRAPNYPDEIFREPAVYGGIILKSLSDGNLVVVDGLQNYGQVPDTLSRPGSSGGALYDGLGRIIGIVIEGRGQPATVTEIARDESVVLSGLPTDQLLSRVVVQSVTQQEVASLSQQLDSAPACSAPSG